MAVSVQIIFPYISACISPSWI